MLVAKTPKLRSEDLIRAARLKEEISGFNRNLKRFEAEASSALNGVEATKKSEIELNADKDNAEKKLKNLDTKD